MTIRGFRVAVLVFIRDVNPPIFLREFEFLRKSLIIKQIIVDWILAIFLKVLGKKNPVKKIKYYTF